MSYSEVASGATFPVSVAHAGDGSGRLFVVEQPGRILVTASNGFAAAPFLDLHEQVSFEFGTEDGLLGLAFPTNYAASGKFYVYYTRTGDLATVVSRFSVSMTNSNVADASSEERILVIPEVVERSLNGGMLVFGPDGYLYISTGDSGYNYYIGSESQKPGSLWGKILRIDVDDTPAGYAVPPDNPFVGRSGWAPEIWALGFRNPWRFCFDRANGDFYASDVGQFIAEEIDYAPAASAAGRNYGWRVREGLHSFFDTEQRVGANFTEPIFEVIHGPITEPRAITGGFVYRGSSRPRMNGTYFFGDFYTGLIEGLVRNNGVWLHAPVLQTPFFLSSFGEDQAGNLYVTDYISGGLFRLDDSGRARQPDFSPAGPLSVTDVITIQTLTPGSIIHYTTNGVDPSASDPEIAPGSSVKILSGATLKARALRSGLQSSEVASVTYFLQAAKPRFNPGLGPFTNNTSIAITSATPNVVIRYSLDGSEPTTGSALYVGPVLFNTNQSLKARAFRLGFADSDVALLHSSPLIAHSPGASPFSRFVSWTAMSNQSYRAQYSHDLTYWTDIGTNLRATNSLMTHTNNAIPPHPNRGFMRIEVE